jgi:hypothetical protein
MSFCCSKRLHCSAFICQLDNGEFHCSAHVLRLNESDSGRASFVSDCFLWSCTFLPSLCHVLCLTAPPHPLPLLVRGDPYEHHWQKAPILSQTLPGASHLAATGLCPVASMGRVHVGRDQRGWPRCPGLRPMGLALGPDVLLISGQIQAANKPHSAPRKQCKYATSAHT